MKAKEKRIIKGYKVKESSYKKAMRRSAKGTPKNNKPLANIIEAVVTKYGNGYDIFFKKDGMTYPIDSAVHDLYTERLVNSNS